MPFKSLQCIHDNPLVAKFTVQNGYFFIDSRQLNKALAKSQRRIENTFAIKIVHFIIKRKLTAQETAKPVALGCKPLTFSPQFNTSTKIFRAFAHVLSYLRPVAASRAIGQNMLTSLMFAMRSNARVLFTTTSQKSVVIL